MPVVREIPLDEVRKHNRPNDLWVVIENNVYDLTRFRSEHPGGEDTLDDAAGRDATIDFIQAGHSSEAKEMMVKYCIGELPASDKKCKVTIKQVGIAVGAVVIGFATILVIKKLLITKS